MTRSLISSWLSVTMKYGTPVPPITGTKFNLERVPIPC